MSLSFSEQARKEIADILANYPDKRAATLPVLHLAQREFGAISAEVEQLVADTLELPIIKIREVLTFYTLLKRETVGQYHLQLCRNLSCTLSSGQRLIDFISRRLGIMPGETSADGRFTLTTVECLGGCQLAPLMQLNERYLGELTEEKIESILSEPEKWA
jgi:NADH-quinone oxidoreductase E subunit